MAGEKQHAGAILTIDLDAVRVNYRRLRRQAGAAACAGVLKADAYGLGAARIAPALAAEGCRHFFVAHLDEGIALRPMVPEAAEIFVLHGPPPDTEPEFLRHRLIPVLNSTEQIAGWRRMARLSGRRLPAIVQVDSGMSRMGLAPAEVDAWLNDPDFLRGIELRYLMSHLACAECPEHPMNASQLLAFNELRARLPRCPASLANSSGIFLGPDFHFDLVRPGAALYGVAPVANAENPMRPVVRLQARIIQTRTIADGDAVGYGVTYRARGRRRIATIATGYADGWLRSLSNRGVALAGGVRTPIVGKVSMDTCSIDVSEVHPDLVFPGACVDLISPEQTVDDVAALAGTIGYEILTSLGSRYHRAYVGEPGI
ncbi:MAG: alanine racemase [Noviherbaspirillum sp.]